MDASEFERLAVDDEPVGVQRPAQRNRERVRLRLRLHSQPELEGDRFGTARRQVPKDDLRALAVEARARSDRTRLTERTGRRLEGRTARLTLDRRAPHG